MTTRIYLQLFGIILTGCVLTGCIATKQNAVQNRPVQSQPVYVAPEIRYLDIDLVIGKTKKEEVSKILGAPDSFSIQEHPDEKNRLVTHEHWWYYTRDNATYRDGYVKVRAHIVMKDKSKYDYTFGRDEKSSFYLSFESGVLTGVNVH